MQERSRRDFLKIAGPIAGGAAVAGAAVAKADTPAIPKPTIDLKRAAEILTAIRHKGCMWNLCVTPDGRPSPKRQLHGYGAFGGIIAIWSLDEIEAIAIAEKYVRDFAGWNASNERH